MHDHHYLDTQPMSGFSKCSASGIMSKSMHQCRVLWTPCCEADLHGENMRTERSVVSSSIRDSLLGYTRSWRLCISTRSTRRWFYRSRAMFNLRTCYLCSCPSMCYDICLNSWSENTVLGTWYEHDANDKSVRIGGFYIVLCKSQVSSILPANAILRNLKTRPFL